MEKKKFSQFYGLFLRTRRDRGILTQDTSTLVSSLGETKWYFSLARGKYMVGGGVTIRSQV